MQLHVPAPKATAQKALPRFTPTDAALFRDTPGGASLEEVVAALHGTDIVLVEGFHQPPGLKIRTARTEIPNRIAVSSFKSCWGRRVVTVRETRKPLLAVSKSWEKWRRFYE